MSQSNTYHIITNWLKRSNIIQENDTNFKFTQYYDADVSLIQILLEADSLFEGNRGNIEDLAENFEYHYDQIINGKSLENIQNSDSIYTGLLEERNVWKLIKHICQERFIKNNLQAVEQENEILPPETEFPLTDFSLMQHLFDNSWKISKASCVRSWLEEIASEFNKIEPRTGGWLYTRAELSAHTRQLKPIFNDHVNELDPDAPYRSSKQLHIEDEKYEKELLKSLYFLIRRGKIEEAFKLALYSDQPWRAASIQGGLYFKDPSFELEFNDGLSYEMEKESGYDMSEGEDELEEEEEAGGNFNRPLWKATCYMISNDSKNYVYERALYGVLCGDLDNILSACETWEDYLWAYYNCMIESKVEKYLKLCRKNEISCPLPGPPQVELDETEFFMKLEQSSNRLINIKASSFYSQLNKHIILNTLDNFLDTISTSIKEHGFNYPNKLETVHIRLLSLIVIYLQSVDIMSINETTDNILRCYIFRLMNIKELRLAIFYCSKLSRHMQLETYTDILAGLEGPLKKRLECLNYGTIHGLNHDNLLVYTAQKCLQNSGAFEPIQEDINYCEFDFSTLVKKVDDIITKQIRSFEWITSDPSLYSEAIILCNQLCRKYMLSGKLWAVDQLLKSMPKNFVLPEWKADAESDPTQESSKQLILAAQEFLNYGICLEAFRQLDRWILIMKRKPKFTAREYKEWEIEAKDITCSTELALRYALNSDWMLNCFPDGSINSASSLHFGSLNMNVKEEISILRQVYIPEMVFSLYKLLTETKDIIPENYLRSFEMCELVAGEKLGLYKTIMNRSINARETRNDLPILTKLIGEAGVEYFDYTERSNTENQLFPDLEEEEMSDIL
ncbi:nuclear pore protein 84/107 [Neoconidiobolus thromboides FSU 785]|nr:nuclear pore protein 84/107 [Neoconidiobolus thromboides FSU 785]